MFLHFEVKNTLDMVFSFFIKCNEELSSANILRETSVGAEFGQFLLFKKFCEFLLVFSQQVPLHIRVSLRNSVSSGNSDGITIDPKFSFATGFPALDESLANSLHKSATAP